MGIQSSAFPVSESIYGASPQRIKLGPGNGQVGRNPAASGYVQSMAPVQARETNLDQGRPSRG